MRINTNINYDNTNDKDEDKVNFNLIFKLNYKNELYFFDIKILFAQ
jgi:hypothetical protein